MKTLEALKPIGKALVGAGVAFCGALTTAATDEVVTTSEWAAIAGATLAALYGVWRMPPNGRGTRVATATDAGEPAAGH